MEHVNEIMKAYSLDAIDYARKFNKSLDFSEASIDKVEDLCTLLYDDIPKGFFAKLIKKTPSEEMITQMSKMLGAYIGEVMIKYYGGNWSVENILNQGNTVVVNIGELKTFPVAKVYKRLTNGPEDNVRYYYFVITNELEKK